MPEDLPPHKYHYVADSAQANRALILFDEPPQGVEVHALVNWIKYPGSQTYHSNTIGWAVVIFFRLMGAELILGVRCHSSASARRFRQRLLNPQRQNVLLRNATVVQHIKTP